LQDVIDQINKATRRMAAEFTEDQLKTNRNQLQEEVTKLRNAVYAKGILITTP
jgi:hypothetical protein